jgi:hypothetical protein
MPERARVPVVTFAAVTLFVVLALTNKDREPRPTPGPRTFDGANILTVPLATIQSFVQDDLQFDSVLGAADEQLVDFQRVQIGTETARRARIEPEKGSYRLDTMDLASGRIIARLYSDVEVPKLGLGPWWTAWWIERKGPQGPWRSVFIPESPRAKRVELRDMAKLEWHGAGQWRQGIARFWIVRGEYKGEDPVWLESWGTCGGCCRQILVVGGRY